MHRYNNYLWRISILYSDIKTENKKKKMKLEYLDGCNTSLTVDDVETIDLPLEDFKKVCHKMIDSMKGEGDEVCVLQKFFENFLETFGEEEDLGYCDQCGSYNYLYKMEI